MRTKLSAVLTLALAGMASAQPGPTTSPPTEGAADPTSGTPTPTVPEPSEPAAVEPTAATQSKQGTAGFDKGFFIKNGDGSYSLRVTGRVQPFFSWARLATTTAGGVETTTYRHNFEVRRARLTFEGNVHTQALLYKLQLDFGRGFLTLKDFHFDVRLRPDVWLRAGQWKRPFSRQQITSSGRLELTDRSITDRTFGAGRDIGIALRNDYEKSPALEWVVGVFNGSGDASRFIGTAEVDPVTGKGPVTGTFSNVPNQLKPAVVARVGINRDGLKGYSEADLEGGPLRWGAAASVWLEADYDHDNRSNQKLQLDYIVKAAGFSTTGGFYAMTDQNGKASFTDQEMAFIGFHVQGGYMLTPAWQAAARYALIDAQLTGGIDQQELSFGGNFYGVGHDAKLAAGVRFTKLGDAALTDQILFELGANVGW